MGPNQERALLHETNMRLKGAAAIGCLLAAMRGRAARAAQQNLHDVGQMETEETLAGEFMPAGIVYPDAFGQKKVRSSNWYPRRQSRAAMASASRKRNRP